MDSPQAQVLPSLIISADSNYQIPGFDDISNFQFMESNGNNIRSPINVSYVTGSVSISMPPSPLDTNTVLLKDDHSEAIESDDDDRISFHSQPIVAGIGCTSDHEIAAAAAGGGGGAGAGKTHPNHRLMLPVKRTDHHEFKDNRYNSFKTWSGRLERQLSTLRGKSLPRDDDDDDSHINPKPPNLQGECLPADRYFDALQGPELETLRVPTYLPSNPFLSMPCCQF